MKGDLRYTNTTIFETFPFPLLDCKDPLDLDSRANRRVGHSPGSGGADGNGKPMTDTAVHPTGDQEIEPMTDTAVHPTGDQEIEPMTDTAVHPTGENYNPREVPATPEAKAVSEVAEKLYTKRQAACKSLNLGLTKVYNYIKGKTEISALSTDHQALITELQALHEQLNNAVCSCYGWPEDTWRDENEVLKKLLELNLALSGGNK